MLIIRKFRWKIIQHSRKESDVFEAKTGDRKEGFRATNFGTDVQQKQSWARVWESTDHFHVKDKSEHKSLPSVGNGSLNKHQSICNYYDILKSPSLINIYI